MKSLLFRTSAHRALVVLLAILVTTMVVARFGVSALSGSSGSASAAKADQSPDAVTVRAAKRGNPRMNLQDGSSVEASYKNATTQEVSNSLNGARPLSLASDDLNVDGYPDLVAGYASANGSFVTVSLANPEAFAPTRPETIEAIKNGQFHDSFLPDVAVLPVPEAPEFLAVGDFDRDGRLDILTATRGNDTMSVALGDEGGFAAPQSLQLPGAVTALVTGQTDNALSEIAVGISSNAGSQVLVYAVKQSVLTDTPVTFALPATATALAIGQFDESSPMDLAVAAGNEVLIIHDGGNPAPEQSSAAAFHRSQIEHIGFSYPVTSVAVGDFISDRQSRTELAALGNDGTIHILAQGRLDTRPLSEAEVFERRQRLAEMREREDFGSVAPRPWRKGQSQSKSWREVKNFSGGAPVSEKGISQRLLSNVKLATGTGEQLMMLDTSNNQLHVVMNDQPAQTAAQAANGESTKPKLVSVPLDVEGAPVAALSMRLSVMALPGLVVLRSNQPAPVFLPNAPTAAFVVDRADDTAAATACTGAVNDCSLRGAIIAANANGAGADIITFNLGINPILTIPTGAGLAENNAATGDLDVNSSLTVTGNTPTTISTTFTASCGDCKVFGMDQTGGFPGIQVSFSGVTVQGGNNNATCGAFFETGGGMDFFLRNTGNIFSMSNSTVQSNTASGCAASHGGGVNVDSANTATVGGASAGTVTFTNVTFTKNSSLHEGGGVALFADKHDVTMTSCTVGGPLLADGNQTTDTTSTSSGGGGVELAHSFGGTGTISGAGSSIQNNSAIAGGGLVIGRNTNASITGVNISNNTSTGAGAGHSSAGGGVIIVELGVAGFTPTISLTDCTISTNHADNNNAAPQGPLGGGVYFSSAYSATLSNCTISGNTAGGGAGVYDGGSGATPAAILTINSGSTISSNTAASVGGGVFGANTTGSHVVLNAITIDSNVAPTGDGIEQQGGFVDLQGTINVNGGDSIHITLGTFTSTSGTLNLTGNFTNSGGTFTHNTGTVNFNGTGAQSLGGTTSSTFNNLTVNKSTGTLTLGVNTPVAGNLNLTAGIFDLGAFTANRTAGGGTLTVSNGTTLKIGGTNTLPSLFTTHSIGATSTIEYSGSSQNVAPLNSSQKYGNLVTSGSGTKTLAGAIGIATSLSIGAGITLDVSATNFGIGFTGTSWANSGTFTPRNGIVTFDAASGTQTLTGTTTFYDLTLNNSGATTSFGSTFTTINHNLTTTAGIMDGGTSTITFTGNPGAISGANAKNFNNLVINSGAAISNTTGGNTNIANDYTNNGTFSQAAGLTTTFSTGADGLHSLFGSPTATTFGNFTINSSNTVDAGSHNFNVVGSTFTVTGTFTGNASTVTFNGGVAQQITSDGTKSFSGLTINNANGVSLSNGTGIVDASVGGLLTLSTDLSVAAGAILQQSGTSGGAADVVGTVRRTDLGVAAKSFGNLNNSIAINSGTAPNPMDVTLVKSAPSPFPAGTAVVPRTYSLTPTGSGISATLKLRYIDPAELALITESKLILWKNISGTWTAQGGAVDLAGNFVSLAGVTSFSDWAIAEGSDLTISKGNNVAGNAVVGQSWTWTLTVNNPGGAAAGFTSGQTIITDNLPNSANISYGSPVSSDVNISCSIDGSKDLTCTAGGSGATIAEAGSFTVQFTAVASVPATYANPRAGGIARIDPSLLINEVNESNNDATSNSVIVAKANTSVGLVSDNNPSVFGQPVTFTATVGVTGLGAGTPSGNVTFKDGGVDIVGCVNVLLQALQAQCQPASLSVGNHTITAAYNGDGNFNTSSGALATQPQTVNKANTSVGLTSSQNASIFGQSVTFTATVAPVAPGAGTVTSTVNFLDGANPIAGCQNVALSSGQAQCITTALTVANHTISAAYAGDPNFNTSNGNMTGNPQVVSNTAVWDGSTSGDWEDNTNWTTNLKPAPIHSVSIPAAGVTNEPAISTVDVTVIDLTVEAGRTLTVSGGRILTATGNTMLIGNLAGGGTSNFNNLTINNAAGVAIGGDANVSGVLTLTSGNTTVAGTLSVGGAGSIIHTAGHIIGNLKKTFTALPPGSFTFEVGTANGYSPMAANVTAGTFPSTLTVKANEGTVSPLNAAFTLKRYWTLTEAGSITANLTFNYLDPTDIMGTEANYRIIRVEGGVATSFPNNCPSPCVFPATNTAVINGVTSFSEWTLGEPVVPTASPADIGGRVTYTNGRPMRGINVSLLNVNTSEVILTRTNAKGLYKFTEVVTGADYIITPFREGYEFNPQNRVINHTGLREDVDFATALSSKPVPNKDDPTQKGDVKQESNPIPADFVPPAEP